MKKHNETKDNKLVNELIKGMDGADGKVDGIIHKADAAKYVHADALKTLNDYVNDKISLKDANDRLQVDALLETSLKDPKTPNITTYDVRSVEKGRGH